MSRQTLPLSFIYLIVFWMFAGVLGAHADKTPTKDPSYTFESLQQMLVKDGFDAKAVESIYARPGVGFDIATVSRYFAHREARLNYGQFTTRRSIRKAEKYLRKHDTVLQKVEKSYGVEKEVIVAIMLVETQLGTVTGNRSVLNSLSTMAALDNKDIRNGVWRDFSNPDNHSRKKFDKWADRKSRWAYNELKAFLTYTRKENIEPARVNGSMAGALGYAQFMPSNILLFAQDGNEDGSVDLFDHTDAIASIASYLKHYGWRPGIDNKKAYKVVFNYNHSKYYVNTVLKIRDLLKK